MNGPDSVSITGQALRLVKLSRFGTRDKTCDLGVWGDPKTM